MKRPGLEKTVAGSLVLGRQRDEERGTVAGLALDVDPAAVVGDDPPGLPEAQPQAAAGLPGGIERIEDVTPLLRLMPGPSSVMRIWWT